MRGTRWLLLLAILAILGVTGVIYRARKGVLQKEAREKPAMLPSTVSGVRYELDYAHTSEGRTSYRIAAQKVSQEKDSSQVRLEGVKLMIYNKTGDKYNLVECASADFDQSASRMYAEGDVKVTLSIPTDEQPKRQLVTIQSSKVTFDVKTGHATTEQPAAFTFANGTGKSVGASYDPPTRELHLLHRAEID